MAYSYNDEQKSSSADVHIDASKLTEQGGESVESISWKIIARLEQILGWFNAIGPGGGTVAHAVLADTATSAQSATTATTANTALEANHATNADNATNATNATNANHAATADSATTASKLSTNAGNEANPIYFKNGVPELCSGTLETNITGRSESAIRLIGNKDQGGLRKPVYFANGVPMECDNTLSVNITGNATTADTATNANHATSADSAINATNANHATSADSAINATNATNATKLSSNGGSATQPVYFANGVPANCNVKALTVTTISGQSTVYVLG